MQESLARRIFRYLDDNGEIITLSPVRIGLEWSDKKLKLLAPLNDDLTLRSIQVYVKMPDKKSGQVELKEGFSIPRSHDSDETMVYYWHIYGQNVDHGTVWHSRPGRWYRYFQAIYEEHLAAIEIGRQLNNQPIDDENLFPDIVFDEGIIGLE